MSAVRVLSPGALALVEDEGRPGWAALGVGPAGAFDRGALRLANRLVGNAESAAGLELLLGGAVLVPDADVWIAVTGAWGAVRAGGAPVEPHTATLLPARSALEFAAPEHGLRYCLALRGGIAVPPVLGSRSRDTLAGLGPAPLAAGDVLPLGPEPATAVPAADLVPVDPPADGPVRLDVLPGPRRDWFTDSAWQALTTATWHVSPRSDRTGVRLEGPALRRTREGELPSEGMVPGAIQVSPDGSPTILGADAPVTGGYPVLGVIASASFDRLAQLRPGQPVLLTPRALRP
ncbi:biotin-dependent carboxyltransferase family protein [Naasia sp. SYSU D00057]|uniref:5-oxoprolinase subunit C family protein n=1 Tax=Naasia sp. SYSU D00057 TaxID=2817380 RepID=UPI001B311619|nr:biotin-dependent carboxyltransferase family protein [Naasia sp. SYSU D00057]